MRNGEIYTINAGDNIVDFQNIYVFLNIYMGDMYTRIYVTKSSKIKHVLYCGESLEDILSQRKRGII